MDYKRKNTSRIRIAPYIMPILFTVLDYCAILFSEYEALGIYRLIDDSDYQVHGSSIYIWVPLILLLFLGSSKAYSHMQPLLTTMQDVFRSVCYGVVACILILYMFKASLLAARLYVVITFSLILINIYILRYVTRLLLKKYHLLTEPIIMIGAGLTAERVIDYFQNDLGYRYTVTGLLDDHPERVSPVITDHYLLLGGFDDAEKVIKNSGVQTVIIAAPGLATEKLSELIANIQPYIRYINYIPNLIGTPMASIEVDTLFSEKILMLKLRNNLARRRNRIFKRCFDLVCTIFGGVLISPLLLILTVMVAIDNHGKVFFAHKRVGKNGKSFYCYKFQSMVPNATDVLKVYLAKNPKARKEWEESFKLTNDPRVTKLGSFLRKTSLDELPQLWNVIRGDMSLVGPRPIVDDEISKYGKFIREYYMVLPGITGMWQASGRSDTTYEERVAMDTWYVRNWSVWIDLMYLFKTFTVVFAGKGAY